MGSSSSNPWLLVILRLSSAIHRTKERMLQSGVVGTIALAVVVMVLEIALAIVSLPSYVFLAPSPLADRSVKGAAVVSGYRLRRAVTLSALFGAVIIGVVQLVLGFSGAWFSFGSGGAHAANLSWDFNASSDYVYNPNEVQIVDGMAIFRATTLAQATVTTPTSATGTTETTIENSGVPTTNTSDNGTVIVPNQNGNVHVDTTETSTPPPSSTPPAPETPPAPVAPPAPVPPPTPAPSPSRSLFYAPSLYTDVFAPHVALAAELPVTGSSQVCESTVRPVLPTIFSHSLRAYTGFTEIANKNGGEIFYQLSTDGGVTWEWWNGHAWTSTILGTEGNTAQEVGAHIASLPVTSASLLFKARFHNDCSSDMELSAISVEYALVSTAPEQTFFTLTAGDFDLTFTDSAAHPIAYTTRDAYVDIGGRHVAYIEATGNVTLSSSSFNVSPSAVSVNLGTPITGVGHMWLLVPKHGADDVIRLCPSALVATSVTTGCLGEVTLSANVPTAQGFALAHLDDPEYWFVEASLGLPSLGIASVATVVPGEQALVTNPVAGEPTTVPTPVTTEPTPTAPSVPAPSAPSTATVPTPAVTVPSATEPSTSVPPTEVPTATAQEPITIIAVVNEITLAAAPVIVEEPHVITVSVAPTTGAATVTIGDTTLSVPNVITDDADHVVVITIDNGHVTLSVDENIVVAAPLPETVVVHPAELEVPRTETIVPGDALDTAGEVTIVTTPVSPIEINHVVLAVTNAAPSVHIDHVAQDATGLVTIAYTARDQESNYLSLPTVEYSTTGAFTGEEHALTDIQDDLRSDGERNLTSSPAGIAHALVWDAESALPPGSDAVYVRIVANDGIESSIPVTFRPVTVDVTAPAITNFSAAQTAGTDTVAVTYGITDAHESGVTTQLSVSSDHGTTWTAATGQVTAQGFSWDAAAEFPGVDNAAVTLRLTATDALGNASSVTQETVIDTKAPYGLTGVTLHAAHRTVIVSWDPLVAEAHFDHYIVRYAADTANARETSWSVRNDTDLAHAATTSTVLTRLSPETPYRVTVEAYDAFGHVAIAETVTTRTLAEAVEPPPLPPIVDTIPEMTTATNVVVSGTAMPATTIEVLVDDVVVAHDVPVDARGEFTTATTLEPGIHEIVVVATNDSFVAETSAPQTVAVTTPIAPVAAAPSTGVSGGSTGEALTGPSPTLGSSNGAGGASSSGTAKGGESAPSANATTPIAQTAEETTIIPTKITTLAALSISARKDLTAVAVLNTASTSRLMPVPTIETAVRSTTGTTIHFAGIAMPHSTIAIFLHSEQAVMYTTEADAQGKWSFDHEQKTVELSPGEHTVYTVAYDKGSNVKSQPSKVITFDVRSTTLSHFGKYFDLPTTIVTLCIAIGALGTAFLRRGQGI